MHQPEKCPLSHKLKKLGVHVITKRLGGGLLVGEGGDDKL